MGKHISWLNKITDPSDLRGLKLETLEALAGEIRQVVAETTSRNGGHFAPSLGVVELTIALHYAFDTPRDQIVWDVGHQAYPHKLLTGRFPLFHTLRRAGGLSGYLKRSESPYDAFGAGHASTSLSAALGMATARDLRGEDYRVAAVCGDGSLTGGMCYEALNYLGYLGTDMLIILNDNEMSISPNIGAMSRYFNQMLTNDIYNRSKATARDLIGRAGQVGQRFLEVGHKIEGSIKNLLVPEENFFERLKIRYLGPVDGHDLEQMIEILTQVRELRGPILLHVKTVKGKGYRYSESDPERWHADGGGFNIDNGARLKPPPEKVEKNPPAPSKYQEVFARSLIECADADERIVAVTAAMPTGTSLNLFAEAHPGRFHDVGIAEAHAVTMAAGMACQGLRPVVGIYSTFLQRAFDQILHDVALQDLPVTFALDRAGVVGEDGPTHHGVFDLAYLRMVPGLVLMAPRDESELRRMVHTAARHEDGPIAYRYPRGSGRGLDLEGPAEPLEIGRGEVLRHASDTATGPRVALLCVGPPCYAALEAAQTLEEEGLGVSVADLRFVKPLDGALLEELARGHDLLVTVEDGTRIGGFGSAVLEWVADAGLAMRVLRLGYPDQWVEHASVAELHRRYGLDADGLTESLRAAVRAGQGLEASSVAEGA